MAADPLRLLVATGSGELPAAVRTLVDRHGVQAVCLPGLRDVRESEHLQAVDVVLICDPLPDELGQADAKEYRLLAEVLTAHHLSALVFPLNGTGMVPDDLGGLILLPAEVTADELWGRLMTVRDYRLQLRKMGDQVSAMQRLGKQLNEHFVEVDQELRLASRLQRDFLPKVLPELGDVRFAVLYRPATWVSGDIYDVGRLDETRLEFFLADAIGHGVSAGLLTMFIKQSVVGKRIRNGRYEIIPPSEVLHILNDDLAAQELPNCQFVTGCYATVDVETHELVFARGGHPHPIHVTAAGECREVRTVGGLLGVFAGEDFPEARLRLEPGEKLIIYSDGLEDLVISRTEGEPADVQFTETFRALAEQPAQACVDALRTTLDNAQGSLQPEDDMTFLVVERLPA